METRQLKPYFVVLTLMALASLVLAYTVDVEMAHEAGVQVYLPDRVGEWEGREILYCQNPEHARTYFAEDLEDRSACPDCGHELFMMSIDERRVLPDDTVILKKVYEHPDGSVVTASIVLSGVDRSSIHRPQLCLVGAGQEIVREWRHVVPMDERDTLRVSVIDMLRRVRGPDGRALEHEFYYAYWFVGNGRETHSNVIRMALMGYDRIVHNVAHRWAYISVSGARDPDGRYVDEISDFINIIYPQMALSS